MIIRYFNIISIAIDKPKTNPPLIVNGDGKLPFPIHETGYWEGPSNHLNLLPNRGIRVFSALFSKSPGGFFDFPISNKFYMTNLSPTNDKNMTTFPPP